MSWDRPAPDEYFPYYGAYVDLVPDGEILETLDRQIQDTVDALAGVETEREGYRYAPDKWSLKEVIGHVVDIERMFGLRALWFARRDPSPLPGMEQDDWASASTLDHRSLQSLLDELRSVRRATVTLLSGFSDEIALVRGTASEREFTVRAIAWIIAGHELHHRKILQERYL